MDIGTYDTPQSETENGRGWLTFVFPLFCSSWAGALTNLQCPGTWILVWIQTRDTPSILHLTAGRKALELGCGAGMLGILLQRVGAAGICLTDGDAQTLCNCLHNLRINGAQVRRVPCKGNNIPA